MTHHDTDDIHDWERAFTEPDPGYGPVPIWWWSGERLDPDRLRWQLERFIAGGVRSAVVLNLAPAGPLHGALADDPPFLSERWWEIFLGVCADAERLGFRLWAYDQLGFSGANLQAEVVTAEADFAGWDLRRVAARGTGELVVDCPPGGTPVGAALVTGTDAVAVEVRDGAARCVAAEESTLLLAYSVRRGFDYCDPDACVALFDRVHGELERRAGDRLGSVIVGTFQDELPTMPTWSAGFAAAFAARHGAPLTGARLAALWHDTGPDGGPVRRDYHATRAALISEAFFVPLHAWHERHGMICGYDQQHPARAGDPVGATELYGDYLSVGRHYGAPGSDHWGDATVHSSLSHVYGRPRTWLEGFHSSGWGGTLEETFDWLLPWLRAGVTLYDPHAAYYSTRAGWWDWAPPSTCWRQPYWPHYAAFSRIVARLCRLGTLGAHECGVALVYPTAAVQAGLTLAGPTPAARATERSYLDLHGSMSWLRELPGPLGDHDVLPDEVLGDAAVDADGLRVGAEHYRTVVLPAGTLLTDEAAATLVRLADGGGRVVCVGTPPTVDPPDGRGAAALAAALTDGRVSGVDGPAAVPADAEVRADVPHVVRRTGADRLVLLTAHDTTTGTVQPMHDDWVGFDAHTFFDFDRYWRDMRERGYGFRPLRAGRTARLSVPDTWPGVAELWDPTTGQRHPLPVEARDGRLWVTVAFAHGPAAVVVFRSTPGATVAAVPEPDSVLAELPAVWSATVLSTLDNRWGDLAAPAGTAPLPVTAWRLDHQATGPDAGPADLAEDGWREAHATFGSYGWQRGAGEWQPAEYSLSRGIDADPLHHGSLGPKGYVPEEFLRWDRIDAGGTAEFRTSVPLGADDLPGLHLAVGAAAGRQAWWNGEPVPVTGDGYLTLSAVSARVGRNELAIRFTADRDGPLRAWWALTRTPDRLARPEWLTGPAEAAGPLRVRRVLTVAAAPERAILQIGTESSAVIRLNGAEVGRQGGFDPYAQNRAVRVRPFDVTALLAPGDNLLEVEFAEAAGAALWVDGLLDAVPVVSGADWTCRLGDGPDRPVRLRREQWHDPRTACLTPRPHPLPGTAWLDPAVDDGSVLRVVPDADPDAARLDWFRFRLPPGATAMSVPVRGRARAFVAGAEVAVGDGEVALPDPDAVDRTCLLAVAPADGGRGGAVFDGPVTYRTGPGRIALGDWAGRGLGSFSGAVVHHQTLHCGELPAGPVWLDLGEVRGTAEIRVNGSEAGVLLWSPYRVRVDRWLRPGTNAIEVVVRNTLGPLLADTSPTPGVFAGQRRSGLFGPVLLRAAGPIPDFPARPAVPARAVSASPDPVGNEQDPPSSAARAAEGGRA